MEGYTRARKKDKFPVKHTFIDYLKSHAWSIWKEMKINLRNDFFVFVDCIWDLILNDLFIIFQ